MPLFWNKIDSSRILRVPSPPCLAYCSCVLFGDDGCNALWVQPFVALKFVELMLLGLILQTVRNVSLTRYHGGRIQRAGEGRGTHVPLKKCICTLLVSTVLCVY